jgi:polyhydroxyalkanoate synthase
MINPSSDPNQFLTGLIQTWQNMMQQFNLTGAGSASGEPGAAGAEHIMRPPANSQELQQRLQQMASLWSGMLGVAAPTASAAGSPADKRFSAEAWRTDPRFDYLRQSYLAYSDFMMRSMESAQIDKKTKSQMGFAMRQVIDAISPANFFATNPEAIQLALKTNGQSLTDGIKLFLQDLAKGRISMTDEEAFGVGKNLAVTEGEVIFENELMQLIQYAPLTEQVGQRPLLMIPPCINKFYILDLQPENSLVRYAVEQGHTVFMLSWRNITADTGHFTWDDYLQKGVMQAIDVACDITGEEQVNALGFCVGGTLLASAVAVMRQKSLDKVASLTLLTTMLDFCDAGEIGMLVDARTVAQREQMIGSGGVLQGKELAMTFSSLRANDLIWSYVVNSYLKGKNPPAFDLLYWNSDATNLPGPMFTWYLRNAYLENNLCKPGRTVQCGVPVDLSQIAVPVYLYASREDHIVPWRTAFAGTQVLGGERTFVLGASGHIAGVINPASKNKRNYWADGKWGGSADEWLATAQTVPGSWWQHWCDWLMPKAGRLVPARKKLGNKQYRKIEVAPGSYVKQKAD